MIVAYSPPGDYLRLHADVPSLFDIADRLWRRAEPGADATAAAVELLVDVFDSAERPEDPERLLVWRRTASGYHAEIPGALSLSIDVSSATARARISEPLLFFGDVGTRTILESSTAPLFARRSFQVLHAGAVTGPAGAVVLRGPSGAGKSTLAAACHRAGLAVLGDESLLVSRRDTDLLASTVRDLTLRPDAAALLEISDATNTAFSGGEEKRRVPLGARSPEERVARRAATLLLGPRLPGPARIVTLTPEEFAREFRRGEIPQERDGGDPETVAERWGAEGGLRLDGASDLAGAVRLVMRFAGAG